MTANPPPGTPADPAPIPAALGEPSEADATGSTAGALEQLEDTLDAALGQLAKHNRQVEDYLSFLKQERVRELQGPEHNQLTIDDVPAPPPDQGAPA